MQVLLFHLRMQLFGAFECIRNAWTDVPGPDMLLKFGLVHQLGGLLARPAKNETPPGIVHGIRQILEGLQTGGVDRRHVAQTKNQDGRQLRKTMDDLLDLVGGAEKKRAVNAEDGHVGRNFLVLGYARAPPLNTHR
jgi:hypothetical protein